MLCRPAALALSGTLFPMQKTIFDTLVVNTLMRARSSRLLHAAALAPVTAAVVLGAGALALAGAVALWLGVPRLPLLAVLAESAERESQ